MVAGYSATSFRIRSHLGRPSPPGRWFGSPPPTSCTLGENQNIQVLGFVLQRFLLTRTFRPLYFSYGYARVSTDGQSVEAQVRQLTKAGCKKVFRETASGAKTDRAQLRKPLDQL
jgi:Resolvase, N terminal domain